MPMLLARRQTKPTEGDRALGDRSGRLGITLRLSRRWQAERGGLDEGDRLGERHLAVARDGRLGTRRRLGELLE